VDEGLGDEENRWARTRDLRWGLSALPHGEGDVVVFLSTTTMSITCLTLLLCFPSRPIVSLFPLEQRVVLTSYSRRDPLNSETIETLTILAATIPLIRARRTNESCHYAWQPVITPSRHRCSAVVSGYSTSHHTQDSLTLLGIVALFPSRPFIFHGFTNRISTLPDCHDQCEYLTFCLQCILNNFQSNRTVPENVCIICKKAFSRKADCNRHRRLHDGIK
jgi:hypothetical protein